MRKIVLIAFYFLVLGSAVYAADLVIGGGGLFGMTWEQYHYPDGDGYTNDIQDVNATTFGAFIFFGLNRYIEGSIAVYAGNNKYTETWNYNRVPDSDEGEFMSSQIGFSLYLKYPFVLGNFVLFPTLGTDLQNNNGGLDLFLGGGVGFDVYIGPKLFIRTQAIYKAGYLMLYKGDLNEDTETKFPAHGPHIKFGLGWNYGRS